jgi:hypothetical protein
MKNFWIFLLFSCFLVLQITRAFGQSDTLHLYQSYHTFSNQEKAEWTAFENNWNYIEYTELKQKQKIKKLNCKNCGSFYADIYIEIDAVGELTTVIFKKGKICGQPISSEPLIKVFEESLKAQTFGYLKNKQFIARFGHILKC